MRAEAAPGRGMAISRFVVLDRLGVGGMGLVLLAYDPSLDRKVAIKLLRPGVGTDETQRTARLLREAQALAKIAHRNVISVYEVGTFGEQVFIAMEYVDGETLGAWLETARPWREVRGRFVQAARGLAAAHALGLVHRDFKPDNVLCAGDGRVLVTDFGIVGVADEAAAGSGAGAVLLGSRPLTVEGAVLGTPGFMAPEQRAGAAVDARADQFAFCVALYAALAGRAPFVGGADTPRPVPGDCGMPRWMRPLVMRGLAHEPGQRHASMTVLADALERGGRSRAGWIAGGASVAAMVAGVALLQGPPATPPCRGMAARLAGVWDDGARAAVREAFAATGRPDAPDTYGRVARRLDDYTRAWVSMRGDACEATAVRREQSQALLDLRMTCLDRRLGAARALIAIFARGPDPAILPNAVPAVLGLEPLSDCADAERLSAALPPPRDPARRVWLGALEGRMEAARALAAAGKRRAAYALAHVVLVEAEALGHAPVVARALQQVAALHADQRRPDTGQAFERAIVAAGKAHADLVLVQAIKKLVGWLAEERRVAEALALRPALLAAAEREGSDGAKALAHSAIGEALYEAGRYADSEAELRLAVTLGERVDIDESMLTNSLAALARTLNATGRYDEASTVLERALDIVSRTLGPDHIYAASIYNELSSNAGSRGDHERALTAARRVLTITEREGGPDSARAAIARVNVANSLGSLHRFDESQADFDRALPVLERIYGADNALIGQVLTNVGAMQAAAGRFDQAQASFERAIANLTAGLGPDHPDLALALHGQAELLQKQRRHREALEGFQRALAIREKTLAADHPDVLASLRGVGDSLVALGRAREALPLLERAQAHERAELDRRR